MKREGHVAPHRRLRRSSEAGVAPQGVHQRVGGEGVVGGPGPHVPLEALNDGPVGPEETQEATSR